MELAELEGEVRALKVLVDKALEIALNAVAEVKALKLSQPITVTQPPLDPQVREFLNEFKPESEPVPQAPYRRPKLSPFAIGASDLISKPVEERLEEAKALSVGALKEKQQQDELWDATMEDNLMAEDI